MRKILLKILPLLLLITAAVYSQNLLEEQFSFAQKLYNRENYFDAVTELKRLLFFDKNKEYYYSANMLIGQSYKAGARLSDAIYYFTLAEINAKTEEDEFNSKIEIIRCNIVRRTTTQSLKLLYELESNKKFINRIDEINYWRGWAYMFADSLEKAAELFGKINREHELALLCKNTEEEKYSERFAKIVSVFIPGAGQIYTGNYLNGVISLVWNVFAGYLTINSFVEDRVFDGIIIGNLLWLRFYVGNIQNAEEFAKDKNLEITNKLLKYLQEDYKGIKP